jgi:riboflavin kinase
MEANLPEAVAAKAGDKLKTGIYYGWASVGSNSLVWPAVMSFGWNPYYKNEKRSAVILL